MADNPAKEALCELLDYLEQVETKCGALMAFFRANGTISDQNLAPFLEHADNATDVKSRAIRARFDNLFAADETTVSAPEANPQTPDQQASTGTGSQSNQSDEEKNAA